MSQPSRILSDVVLSAGPVVVSRAGQRTPRPEDLERERAVERAAYDRGYQEGLVAGREQGLSEGRQAAEAELARASAALSTAMAEVAAERRRVLADVQDGALRLALTLARKIVHTELAASGEAAARAVEAAVRHAQDATVLRVRVHPDDKARIEQVRPEAVAELIPDPALSPGGCLVETDCGEIDATVETQWQALSAALEAEIQGGEAQDARTEPPAAEAEQEDEDE